MERRRYVQVVGLVAAGSLAGCLDDPIDEDELDDISEYLDDAIVLVETVRTNVENWDGSPEEQDRETYTDLESEAEELFDHYESTIEPLLDNVEDSEIERTVEGEGEWTIDGEDMRSVLENLGTALSNSLNVLGIILEADLNPDAIGEGSREMIDNFLTDSNEAVEDAQQLWYRGGF